MSVVVSGDFCCFKLAFIGGSDTGKKHTVISTKLSPESKLNILPIKGRDVKRGPGGMFLS